MIEIPDTGSVGSVADWVELNVATRRGAISKMGLASYLEGFAGEEPSEAFISTVWRELESREHMYSYPFFRVEDQTVEPQADSQASPEYLACLILSLFGVPRDTQLPAKLFERLTCRAVKKYLSGKAVVFGFPPETDVEIVEGVETESSIKRKVKKLACVLNEKFCEAPPVRFNDRGLDVVGWIPFNEKRSGQSVLLLQCAAGHNWKDKLPVPIDAWCQYIHWACNPIRGFVVPCIVSKLDWHEKSTDKGILFDRVRIINLISDDIDDSELHEEINAWVQAQLNELN